MAAEALHHPDAARIALVEVLAALGHPVRLEIVRTLAGSESEVYCGAVAEGLPRSTVTHHLRTLREAGVICQRPEGRKLFLTLRRADLEQRFPGLLALAVGDFPGPEPAVGPAP
ncbi:helix-turn-helix domain-containing protein [Streptomyces sp. NBC_00190]|uniref:ArsR/SmtB family transcription factor n=1 Tax=unclassified Streptomyces TaxID=2593676 RepID=UPI002E2C683A|nr:metalloregulator ArsR/SmtB family transcription factor [Streptomyces sp. NBC_00190]WSZ41974.1 helix-turn-helix domain-containing protein [Streptomyces sp. NBC_00868]